MAFYIVVGVIVLVTGFVEAISRIKRVRRAWYVLRTGDKYPDFAKLASDYFGVGKKEEKWDEGVKPAGTQAGSGTERRL
jgi:hypothetical protein